MKNMLEKINDPLERQEIYADYCDFWEAIEGFKINIPENKKMTQEISIAFYLKNLLLIMKILII